jgi:hypothetical protein
MTVCIPQITVDFHQNRPVDISFDASALSSDAGFIPLRYVDDRLGLSRWFSQLIPDARQPGKVRHSRQEQVMQRLYQIAMGYEDANDANTLRLDPVLQMACVVDDEATQSLSSQPTISRLENAVDMGAIRQIMLWFEDTYVASLPSNTELIILDIDSTEDPTYGSQQLSFFNAHYDNYMYHPLMIFDGITGQLIVPLLRPGNVGAARGAIGLLRRLIRKLKARFPSAQVIVRGDSAFATPTLLDTIERLDQEHGDIDYLFGFAKNSRVIGLTQTDLDLVRLLSKQSGQVEIRFTSFQYQATSWTHARRIIAKAEHGPKGSNPRFLVTSLNGFAAEQLYHAYCERGCCENRIKDFKNALNADRLSCSSFKANFFRLLLHAAAYRLMFELRNQLAVCAPELGAAQFDTIRLKLLKVAVIVKKVVRRIHLRLPKAFPLAWDFRALVNRLTPELGT